MKTLLTLLLCLLTLTSTYAQGWPRNSDTEEVEFKGVLPWPANAKTEEQRRELVRQWYLANLTEDTSAELDAQEATRRKRGLLTYAGMPKINGLQYKHNDNSFLLTYQVELVPSGLGLRYSLIKFEFQRTGGIEESKSFPLESVIDYPISTQQAAISDLHKRLVSALASW